MPIYNEHCHDCGIDFEALLITQDDRESVACPRCQSKHIEVIPATFSFKFAARSPLDFKRGPCHNPYDNLTLYNVRDEQGKPIKVNSRRELEAAEKKHSFVHALSHAMTRDQLDTPPTNESWAGDIRVSSGYEWKWQRDPSKQKDVSGVSIGAVTSHKETLA